MSRYNKLWPFNLTVLSLNIRSICKNYGNLLAFLHMLKKKVSIIMISETWLRKEKEHLYPLDGYNQFAISRSSRAGGLMINIDKNIDASLVPSLTNITDACESLYVEFTLNRVKYHAGLIYRPPNKSIVNFVASIANIFNTMPKSNCIIGGGFNANLLAKPNNNGLNFVSTMLNHGLKPIITTPTRLTNKSATLIDHIWCSINQDFISYVITEPISDHYPVLAVWKINTNLETKKAKIRPKDPKRFEAFGNDFFNYMVDSNFLNNDCPVTLTNDLISHLQANCNHNFPQNEVNMKGISLKSPWIDSDLAKCIKKKYELFENYMNNLIPYSTYTKYRNLLTKTISLARKIYHMKKFDSLKNDPKKAWQVINKYLDKAKDKTKFNIKLNSNEFTEDTDIISTEFSEYYKSSVNELIESSPDYSCELPETIEMNQSSMFFYPTDRREIAEIINGLKPNNFHLSEIPVALLQSICHNLSIILEHIFNLCFEKHVFPDVLKVAHIIPIFKKGSKHLVENFRPISLLNPIAKIFEKLMYRRLLSFFHKFDLLSKYQFGFLPKKSTDNAVLTFLHDVYLSSINGEELMAVFIDLKKAFDTVNHSLLLEKCERYGVRGASLKLLQSYLTNRYTYVQIGDSKSEYTRLTTGVPQGSCLGPLLFIIFINDVINLNISSKTILYADDLVIYNNNFDSDSLNQTINNDLDNFFAYTLGNKLFVNQTKCKYIIFNKLEKISLHSINIDSINLEAVDEFKYLGITIDKNLKFKAQIQHIVGKLNQFNGIIYTLRSSLSLNSLKKILYAIGYSFINSHILAWGRTCNKYLSPIRVSLNKCIRNIYFHDASYDDYTHIERLARTCDAYEFLNIYVQT